jgi:hypothetical protein
MANPHTRNNMQLDFMGRNGHAISNWIMWASFSLQGSKQFHWKHTPV